MTKVEEVARAICLAELPTDEKWRLCIPAAVAAMKAMREPTKAMVSGTQWSSDMRMLYRDMIDIAINEQVDDV